MIAAGTLFAKIVAAIPEPDFDDEEFPVEFDNDEPRVPGTPREEEEECA